MAHKAKNFPLVGGNRDQVKLCFSIETDKPEDKFLDIVLDSSQAESLIESLVLLDSVNTESLIESLISLTGFSR